MSDSIFKMCVVTFFCITLGHVSFAEAGQDSVLNEICEKVLNGNKLSGVKYFPGKLCAIKPSRTHTKMIDTDGPFGFGYHVLGVPKNLNANTLVWIHFSGAFGRPYDPVSREFKSQLWMSEIVKKGYLAIGLAIDNSQSLNAEGSGVCYNSRNDGCVWKYREDVLTGSNFSNKVSLNFTNSVLGRIKYLADYLEENGFASPLRFSADLTWSEILEDSMLSGHSQGSGYAYYIAMYNKVRGACAFGGPGDPADLIRPYTDKDGIKIVDWILFSKPVNSLDHFFGLTLETDPWSYHHEALMKALGLKKGAQYDVPNNKSMKLTDINGNDISDDGHGAVMGAIEMAEERSKCFSAAKPL